MGSVYAKFTLSHRNKIIFTAIYLFALTIYLFVGLRPSMADASGDIRLQIPDIQLAAPVLDVEKQGSTIPVPDRSVGAYHSSENKTLLVGHSSTVFHDLNQLNTGDTFTYDNQEYTITEMETMPKSAIKMATLLAPEAKPTLILMTCAGDPLGDQDYTHRLIITAIKD